MLNISFVIGLVWCVSTEFGLFELQRGDDGAVWMGEGDCGG